jgi:hypothetical protein
VISESKIVGKPKVPRNPEGGTVNLEVMAGIATVGLMVWDLASTSLAIFHQKTFKGQLKEVAVATGRWAGMAYGAAACAEFGPYAAVGCGIFGGIFGEAAVRAVVAIPTRGIRNIYGFFFQSGPLCQSDFERYPSGAGVGSLACH